MAINRINIGIGIPKRKPIRIHKQKIIRITGTYAETETIEKVGSKRGDSEIVRDGERSDGFESPDSI